jgi:ATP-dependent metalloprotease FtsH
VSTATVPDSALIDKRFRVISPPGEDYVLRARKLSGDSPTEITHLLECLFTDPDPSLEEIFKVALPGKPHYHGLKEFLRRRIVGQDPAIEAVLDGLRVSELRLKKEKPYSLALLGPTGVGKTEIVKQTARFLFGERDEKKRFLCLNLSRFQMETAHELIFGGSPWKGQPGEGILYPFLRPLSSPVPGALSEYRLNQCCIILLDEVEKAHPTTLTAFLSLLDEGVVETIHGQAHCRFDLTSQCLLFLTSNAASSLYDDDTVGGRFLQNQELIKQALQAGSPWKSGDGAFQGERVSGAVKGFRPEFLGRIDTFIMFSKLRPSHMEEIAELNLGAMSEIIRSHNSYKDVKSVTFDPAVKTLFAFKDGFQYGVRNLRTLIESTLSPPLMVYAETNPTDGIRQVLVELKDEDFHKKMCLSETGVHVLAVDDPEDLRDPEAYRNHFKDLEFTWDSASSWPEALGLLKRNAYSFVLMDADVDILRQIRRRYPTVPVFLFSDEVTEGEKNKIMQAGGARDFLRKDIDEEEIQSHLRTFQKMAIDLRRIEAMKSTLEGQANGFSFEVMPPKREGETLILSIGRVVPVHTPRTDDLGLYTQERAAVLLRDVQGIDPFRAQIEELIQILRNPLGCLALGGRLPRGVMLYGPPGTGKTMLAKAIAYETGFPFLHTSSGALASRYAVFGDAAIEAFFSQARRNAPCVVFIDEIDGLAPRRGTAPHSLLLHSLLGGIDSIPVREPVLFVAATNRPEGLDPALTRPGRFDRKFAMEPPSRAGREAILGKLLLGYDTKDLDLNRIARLTSGFTGAHLVSLFNEAALAAKRKGRESITQDLMEEVIDLVKFGPETDLLKHPDDRRRVAVHELGHAILTLALGTAPLLRVSLVSRSHYLGMSETLPDEEGPQGRHRNHWLRKIAVSLGGRVAEEIVFGQDEGKTAGAESDLEKATKISLKMVSQWGMAPGPKGAFFVSREDYLGQEEVNRLYLSERTAEALDRQVQDILVQAEATARETLEKHRHGLLSWAETLMEKEEMSGGEVAELMGIAGQPQVPA